jgi:hypothetical protein
MADHAEERLTHKRLPIAKVFLGAFLIPWYQRTRFLRSLAILIVCQILLVLAWNYSGAELTTYSEWLLYSVHLLLFTLVAVRCHRLILLDAGTENVFEFPKWTWRETRFLGYIFGVWLIMTVVYMVAMMVIAIPAVNLPGASAAEGVPTYVGYLASIPAYYLCGRFCLVLPAVAIDAAGGRGLLGPALWGMGGVWASWQVCSRWESPTWLGSSTLPTRILRWIWCTRF